MAQGAEDSYRFFTLLAYTVIFSHEILGCHVLGPLKLRTLMLSSLVLRIG